MLRWVGFFTAVGMVGCGSEDPSVDPRTAEEACSSYVQGAFTCISQAYDDPQSAAIARDGLDGTCECLERLSGAEADAAIDFYDCATRVVAEGDCTSNNGYIAIGSRIGTECASAGGGSLPACEDYIDVASDCIEAALAQTGGAQEAIGALSSACIGTGNLVGAARDEATATYECAIEVYERGNCFTLGGYAAIIEETAERCFDFDAVEPEECSG
ncbi:MAG: hypothetical protein AAF211_01490 [Myxococcota bacterium]